MRLDAQVFETTFPRPLGEMPTPGEILEWFSRPPAPTEELRGAVRALLREGGFKPSGRSKPAAEYLARAAGEGNLGSINLAVDVCNVVSLHTGLPISVVDRDLALPPFRLGVAADGDDYVFNPSGQILDLKGLLCLWDAQGPCGSPVKDSQRTKTHPGTLRTLSVVWGTHAVPGASARAAAWYHELLRACGATVQEVSLDAKENSVR